ncbi:MAG: hypothetical protein IPG00_17790 [Saprospiraceae bacterium]|nr:hypothetical protein [Saprospiraceae bacterium]
MQVNLRVSLKLISSDCCSYLVATLYDRYLVPSRGVSLKINQVAFQEGGDSLDQQLGQWKGIFSEELLQLLFAVSNPVG